MPSYCVLGRCTARAEAPINVMPSVAVVYALPDRQVSVRLVVDAGTTVAEAVAQSGLAERFAEIEESELACAIYGRVVLLTQVLADGDRVEILRPLLIDPKENRRRSAAKSSR
jgi:putative ubiquitin-RnfH superfamily antitoxin RatB of RatAB toxin-antitoxin module